MSLSQNLQKAKFLAKTAINHPDLVAKGLKHNVLRYMGFDFPDPGLVKPLAPPVETVLKKNAKRKADVIDEAIVSQHANAKETDVKQQRKKFKKIVKDLKKVKKLFPNKAKQIKKQVLKKAFPSATATSVTTAVPLLKISAATRRKNRAKLNGNNGSHTNTDDVKLPNNRKKAMKKVVAKLKRKTVKKGKTKKVPKAPVNTALVPGSLIQTYHTKTSFRVSGRGETVCRVKGRQRLALVTTGTITQSGACIINMPLSKETFDVCKLKEFFKLYERWRPNKLVFEVVPHQASTVAGSYYMFVEPDPQDVVNVIDIVDLNQLANQQRCVENTIYGGASVVARTKDRKDPDLWTSDTVNYIYESNSAPDSRLYSAGNLLIYIGNPIAANTIIGTLFVDFDITFKIAVESSPLTTIVDSGFASSVNSASTIQYLLSAPSTLVVNKPMYGPGSIYSNIHVSASYDSAPSINAAYNSRGVQIPGTKNDDIKFQLGPGEYYLECNIMMESEGNGLRNIISKPSLNFAGTSGNQIYTERNMIRAGGTTNYSDTAIPFNLNYASWILSDPSMTPMWLSPVPRITDAGNGLAIKAPLYADRAIYKANGVFRVPNATNPVSAYVGISTGCFGVPFCPAFNMEYTASTNSVYCTGLSFRIIRLDTTRPQFLPTYTSGTPTLLSKDEEKYPVKDIKKLTTPQQHLKQLAEEEEQFSDDDDNVIHVNPGIKEKFAQFLLNQTNLSSSSSAR